jgi:hypothetical protein
MVTYEEGALSEDKSLLKLKTVPTELLNTPNHHT